MTTPDVQSDTKRKPAWLRAVQFLLCAAVVIAVAWTLVKQLKLVDWAHVRFAPLPSLLSILALLGVSACQVAARWTLLSAYNQRIGWRIQLAASWIPQLGKYLPGGVASIAGIVFILRKYKVPGAVAVSVAVLLDAMAVIAGLIVSTPLLLWEPVRARFPLAWIVCAAMIAIGLILLHPRIFVALLNWLLRKLKRQPIAAPPPLARYIWPLIASFAQWLFAGLALYFMALTLTPVPPREIPLFIASAALAMTISYLTPFTPGGIGIREYIYLVTLRPLIGPQAALVALILRLLQTILEIALAVIGMLLLRDAAANPPPNVILGEAKDLANMPVQPDSSLRSE